MKVDSITDGLLESVTTSGYAIVPNAVPLASIPDIETAADATRAGTRNVLSVPAVRELACSEPIRSLVEPVLGANAFAVRAILFNKQPGTNWKVGWHQDCVIAVRDRKDVPGWGPWSVKAGVVHVRPPAELLEGMLAVRIHLDDCGEENGPLRVIPKSHTHGLLTDDEIIAYSKNGAITCTAQRGDVILMRPLLLHASSPATNPSKRRVVHIEYAAEDLPSGLQWNERVELSIHAPLPIHTQLDRARMNREESIGTCEHRHGEFELALNRN